jgi:hypothetical protein
MNTIPTCPLCLATIPNNISTLILGGYKEKYLKYKQKYIALKRVIII